MPKRQLQPTSSSASSGSAAPPSRQYRRVSQPAASNNGGATNSVDRPLSPQGQTEDYQATEVGSIDGAQDALMSSLASMGLDHDEARSEAEDATEEGILSWAASMAGEAESDREAQSEEQQGSEGQAGEAEGGEDGDSDWDDDDDDGGDGEDGEEMDIEVTVEVMRELEKRDATKSRKEQREIEADDEALRRWTEEVLDSHFARCSEEMVELAYECLPVVKKQVTSQSKGLLHVVKGSLRKSFDFKSSLLSSLLNCRYNDHHGSSRQVIDKVLAVMLHHGHGTFREAFRKMADNDTLLDLDLIIKGAAPARGAKVTGIYVRKINAAVKRYYVGKAINIHRRQIAHDSKPINKLARAATDPSKPRWRAHTLLSFGPTKLAQIPPPLLSAVECLIIGSAGLITRKDALQINLIDRAPHKLPRVQKPLPPSSLPKLDKILVQCWNDMHGRIERSKAALKEYPRGAGFEYPQDKPFYLTPYADAAGVS